jgi:hypothetical protein
VDRRKSNQRGCYQQPYTRTTAKAIWNVSEC